MGHLGKYGETIVTPEQKAALNKAIETDIGATYYCFITSVYLAFMLYFQPLDYVWWDFVMIVVAALNFIISVAVVYLRYNIIKIQGAYNGQNQN